MKLARLSLFSFVFSCVTLPTQAASPQSKAPDLAIEINGFMPQQCRVTINDADTNTLSLSFDGKRDAGGNLVTKKESFTFKTRCNFSETYTLELAHTNPVKGSNLQGLLVHDDDANKTIAYTLSTPDGFIGQSTSLTGLSGDLEKTINVEYTDDPTLTPGHYSGAVAFVIKGS